MSKKERVGIIVDVTEVYIKYPALMRDGDRTAEFGLQKTQTIETEDGRTVIPQGMKTVTPLWGVSKPQIIEALTKQKNADAAKANADSAEMQSKIDNVTAIKN